MKALSSIAIIAIVLAIVAGVVWYEVAVWRECLATNSWWYCLRVLAK